MGTRALILAFVMFAVAEARASAQSCNSIEDCPAPPGRCEAASSCDGVCYVDERAGCHCEVSSECNDGNACTLDMCSDLVCAHMPATGPGCCTTASECPAPNACQIATCAQSRCGYSSTGAPGCCNTSADCDGQTCTDNMCGGAPPPAADLTVSVTDAPDPVAVGGTLTYTIVVHDAGAAPASNVVVTDVLAPGVTFVSASPSCWARRR
jgi:uncharacterized repeat protein (TIGR01451 family)